MLADIYPLQVLLLTVSGWVNRHQADVLAYLVEENRAMKVQLQGRKLRLTDDRGDSIQETAAELLGNCGEAPPLTVGQPESASAGLFLQHAFS